MDKLTILAVVDAVVNEHINNGSLKGLRGQRGQKGKPGQDFDFSENEIEILSAISNAVSNNSEKFKLKFSDLTDDEKDFLKLKFENLTLKQIESLKGETGKHGRNFLFSDHKDRIFSKIESFVSGIKEDFKLRFSDLTEDEKKDLKGLDGKPGKDFSYEENKELIYNDLNNIVSDKSEKLKLKFSDLTEDEKEGLKGSKGSRGQRGKPGQNFDYEESHKSILNDLSNIVEEKTESFKLKFSDLSDEEKEDLKLKFSDLSSEETLELKGDKGARGQRGKQGFQGDQGEIGLTGKTGEKGDRGLRGSIGLQGLAGPNGLKGERGSDGEDAPIVVDIEIEQKSKEYFSFVFYFSNGKSIETDQIKIPSISMIYQSFSSGGGSGGGGLGALLIKQDGVDIGEAQKLNFVNSIVEVDGTDPTQINVTPNEACIAVEEEDAEILGCADRLNFINATVEVDDIDPKKVNIEIDNGNCVAIEDEGLTITDCAKKINFIGDNVFVVPEVSIADWPTLSDVDNMATYGGDTGTVEVHVTGDAQKLSRIFVAGENIFVNDIIRLGSDQKAFKATNNGTYEDAQAIGIAIEDGVVDSNVSVLLFGVYENGALAFSLNNPFFLGVNGVMTQNPPADVGEFVVELGQSLGTGAVFMDVKRPMEIVSWHIN